jgi:hypothetical protein
LEATQTLALSAESCDRRVWVRLAEEKPETTFLDAVYLRAGGTAVPAASCDASHGDALPPYCADDGRYHTLRTGESLLLLFELPDGSPCRNLELVADGFYRPR